MKNEKVIELLKTKIWLNREEWSVENDTNEITRLDNEHKRLNKLLKKHKK